MHKKIVFLTLAFILFFSAVLGNNFKAPLGYASSEESLTSQESQVVAMINGTNACNYDLELEKIALNHSLSNYAFRSGGSDGATATAMWLKEQFESFGLATSLESFEFTNWNLPDKPIMIIDEDGDPNTTNDQTKMNSFQSEHYSWPTPEGGVFADLVVLPLPTAANYSDVGKNPIDTALWNAINTHEKIVLIGREVRLNHAWEETYSTKLRAQPPAAVIYTWWYDWMSFVPPFFGSASGRPSSNFGPYYWNLTIPVGWVNYQDGLFIRNSESSSINLSARVEIHSVIGAGPHYNVVGRLQGNTYPNRSVIVSAHYDTVMTAGFADNGAGTAGVIELSRIFAEASRKGIFKHGCTILFIAFTSEELGLVGSTNYVMQHKAEMKNITAVMNLDCIGNDDLKVARTDALEGSDLDKLVLKATDDLNISATLTDQGGSDQEVFRNPMWADGSYSWWWPGLNSKISDAIPVESSTMLISYPLFYSDKWNLGTPGWIHTSYDNSTSTQKLGWVEPSNLEDQIKVAALSTMRLSPTGPEVSEPFSFPFWTLGVVVTGVIVAVVVVYFLKIRKPPVKNIVPNSMGSYGALLPPQ